MFRLIMVLWLDLFFLSVSLLEIHTEVFSDEMK